MRKPTRGTAPTFPTCLAALPRETHSSRLVSSCLKRSNSIWLACEKTEMRFGADDGRGHGAGGVGGLNSWLTTRAVSPPIHPRRQRILHRIYLVMSWKSCRSSLFFSARSERVISKWRLASSVRPICW